MEILTPRNELRGLNKYTQKRILRKRDLKRKQKLQEKKIYELFLQSEKKKNKNKTNNDFLDGRNVFSFEPFTNPLFTFEILKNSSKRFTINDFPFHEN